MPSLEIALAFLGSAFMLALAPGPDNIFVLGQSALYGASAGICTSFGLMTGVMIHTAMVAVGVAALLVSWPAAFMALKIVGAAYLLWLAWQSLHAQPVSYADDRRTAFPGYTALYRRGVLMSVTNPKLALFFLAFLPQFCVAGAGSLQIIVFGGLFILASFFVFLAVSLLGGRLAAVLNTRPMAQVIIHRLTAALFAGLAIALFFVDAGESSAV